MTKENIEELANRNEAYYKIYALGEFATLDKLVFPKYEKRLLNKDELKQLPSLFGLDFGFTNDPTAFMHVKIDRENKKLYILEEYVKKGLLNNQIAEAITSPVSYTHLLKSRSKDLSISCVPNETRLTNTIDCSELTTLDRYLKKSANLPDWIKTLSKISIMAIL